MGLDLLTLTASEAQRMLSSGELTSTALVEAYLAHIEKQNHAGMHLNILNSVAPRQSLLDTARRLDEERQAGKVRSALHGIPFICKDVFLTEPSLGLPTTAGSPYWASAKARRTSPVIQHLLDQGMILLGKANLTEWCGLKMTGLKPGFSPFGGQTQSPYIFGGNRKDDGFAGHSNAGGSSSGSAAGVAAGFAPVSIGTECVGSVIFPANRAGLYALKCGRGRVDDSAMFKFSENDFIGGMAKGVPDLSKLVAAMMKKESDFDLSGELKGMKLAFIEAGPVRASGEEGDGVFCKMPGDSAQQMADGYKSAATRLRELGAVVTEEAKLPDETWQDSDGRSLFYRTSFYLLRNKSLPEFFSELAESEVQSLEDIIRYNEEHRDSCMPEEWPKQDELETLRDTKGTDDECEAMVKDMRQRGEAFEKLFDAHDIVLAPVESNFLTFASATGCPAATVPLGTVKYSEENERPYGLCAVAKQGGEHTLLSFMAGFEKHFPSRPVPRPLQKASM